MLWTYLISYVLSMLLLSPISICHSTDSNCCPFCISLVHCCNLVKIFVLSEPSTSSTLSYITSRWLHFSFLWPLSLNSVSKPSKLHQWFHSSSSAIYSLKNKPNNDPISTVYNSRTLLVVNSRQALRLQNHVQCNRKSSFIKSTSMLVKIKLFSVVTKN